MAKILLMENEKILQDSNEIQVQEHGKDSEIITKYGHDQESVDRSPKIRIPPLGAIISTMVIILKD
jgi:hypothetical protein